MKQFAESQIVLEGQGGEREAMNEPSIIFFRTHWQDSIPSPAYRGHIRKVEKADNVLNVLMDLHAHLSDARVALFDVLLLVSRSATCSSCGSGSAVVRRRLWQISPGTPELPFFLGIN